MSFKEYASKEWTREEISSAISEQGVIKPFPVESVENLSRLVMYYVNIENLIPGDLYFFNRDIEKYPDAGTHLARLFIQCDNGDKVYVAAAAGSQAFFHLAKPYGTRWELRFDNINVEIDLTDRSSSETVIVKTNYSYLYLQPGNNAEYIPNTDYSPATKKYVDDSVKAVSGASTPTEMDAVELIAEMGLITPLTDSSNFIFADNNNIIYF